MHPIAILSDVHGNLEALQAVLLEIDRLGIQQIYSLGDTVGYGPNPVECAQLIKARCVVWLMGNHEFGLVVPEAAESFNSIARDALDWSRVELLRAGLLESLAELPTSHRHEDLLFVHGSVNEPIDEYLTEADPDGYSKFDEVVESLASDFTGFSVCFVGHNHLPFLATQEGYLHPHDQQREFVVAGEKLFVSVGSVGQPRDGDARSCFCTYDGTRVVYHRVAYPCEVTACKIRECGLNQRLAARLVRGR